MAGAQWHRNRRRAESFGAGVADYDRFRPPYADGLFDDLAALHPDGVLDVGCGNGRAAVGLVARGLDVLGVEPDERMAAVARSHGVRVEIEPTTFSADGWIDLLGTFSDHATMESDLRAELFARLRSVIDGELGGTLHAMSCTHALRCVRSAHRHPVGPPRER